MNKRSVWHNVASTIFNLLLVNYNLSLPSKYFVMDLFAPQHLILILLILVLMFGGKKIPELMRGLGKGIREFNDAKNDIKKGIEEHVNDTSKTNDGADKSKTDNIAEKK